MPRVVIIANGYFDPSITEFIFPDDLILCADGGANHALSAGIIPHTVIGDFDSISSESLAVLEQQGVALHQFSPTKNESDLELTIGHALTLNPSEIIVLCAAGKRLDHLLGNILLLARKEFSHIPIFFRDDKTLGRIIHAGQALSIQSNIGDTLSVIPISSTVSGVNLSGVAWPLNNATLSLGSSWSLSNRFLETNARLSIQEGVAALLVPYSAVFE